MTTLTTNDRDEAYAATGCLGIARLISGHDRPVTITRLGAGAPESRGDRADEVSVFFRLSDASGWYADVATTAGDPIWADEDPSIFAEHAEACGVEIA